MAQQSRKLLNIVFPDPSVSFPLVKPHYNSASLPRAAMTNVKGVLALLTLLSSTVVALPQASNRDENK